MDGYYSVSIDANLEATIYNKTEAIRLAKEEAKREENKKLLDAKSAAKQAKKDKAAEKQRLAVRLKNYKDVAADNDRIRTSKAKIEEARYNDELAIAAQEEKDKKLIEEAKARNAKAADDWAKKFKKANPNATPEEVEAAKQDYIKVENAKSEHEINDATRRKKAEAAKRSSEMDMAIEAATPVADTSELYAEQQQQATDAKAGGKKAPAKQQPKNEPKKGKIMFEIAEVSEEIAREALRLAMHKLPIKTKFLKREDVAQGGDVDED